MAGKVLAVATLAALTGVLNLASMSLTVLEGTRLVAAEAKMSHPLAARRGGVRRHPADRVPVRVGHGRDRRARPQLQGGADAADAGLLPVHGARAHRGRSATSGLSGVTAFIPGVGVTLLARDLILGTRHDRRWRSRCWPARRSTARPRWRSPRGSTIPSVCSSPTRRGSASAPGCATSCGAARRPPTA